MMTHRTMTMAVLGTLMAGALHAQAVGPAGPDILWSYDTGG